MHPPEIRVFKKSIHCLGACRYTETADELVPSRGRPAIEKRVPDAALHIHRHREVDMKRERLSEGHSYASEDGEASVTARRQVDFHQDFARGGTDIDPSWRWNVDLVEEGVRRAVEVGCREVDRVVGCQLCASHSARGEEGVRERDSAEARRRGRLEQMMSRRALLPARDDLLEAVHEMERSQVRDGRVTKNNNGLPCAGDRPGWSAMILCECLRRRYRQDHNHRCGHGRNGVASRRRQLVQEAS